MTSKEKAEELLHKMHNADHCYIKHLPNERYCDCIAMNSCQAKQCALIAVDELIKATVPLTSTYYWQEVKQEIENL